MQFERVKSKIVVKNIDDGGTGKNNAEVLNENGRLSILIWHPDKVQTISKADLQRMCYFFDISGKNQR